MKSNLLYSLLTFAILAVASGCSDIHLMNKAPATRDIEVKVAHYCPEAGRTLVNVFAFNLSSQTTADAILFDTDRDGLSDDFEAGVSVQNKYNVSVVSPDTNGDGYSDLFSYNIGYDVENQAALAACEQPDLDTDRDLLSDCEEAIIGTSYNDPDTDKDGIPDGIEFRFGLNPLDPLDSGVDNDGDGYNNLEEVTNNTPIYTSEAASILKHKLTYKVDAYLNQDNEQCYEVEVSGIPLVNVSNGNMIKLMFLERQSIQGQEQVNFLRDVTIIASRGLPAGHEVLVDEVSNQTIVEAVK